MTFFEDAERCTNTKFVVGLIFATFIVRVVLVFCRFSEKPISGGLDRVRFIAYTQAVPEYPQAHPEGAVYMVRATSVPSAAKGLTTRRFTHAEAKEQAKRLKLQEGRLQQLEEQKEKLGKNLEKKEEENRKLVTEGRKKDRAVEDLQDRLLEAMSGRRHTACIDRLAKRLKLQEARLKQLEEQKGKLVKNAENQEER